MTNMDSRASNQWATRPADQRFWSLDELHDAVVVYKHEAKTANVKSTDIRVEADAGDLRLVGKAGIPASLTNYSFGQLSRLADAPAGYLATLPATLAAQNLNHGFAKRGADAGAKDLALLFRANGALELRAAVTEAYERIWNADITGRLRDLGNQGWKVPPAMKAPIDGIATRRATEADCGEYTLVKAGDVISPSGLYASDRDLFAFMIHPERVVRSGNRQLFRGFFVWNSEVGDKSFGISTFLFDYVCFNHNVWGSERLADLRIRHVGDASVRWTNEVTVELKKYAEQSASDDEARIVACRNYKIAGTKAEVIDKLFGSKALGLSRNLIESAYSVAEANTDAYGDSNSAWAIGNGLTEVSQKQPYAEARVRVDRAAGKVYNMAF
jgi:hypothetical protein